MGMHTVVSVFRYAGEKLQRRGDIVCLFNIVQVPLYNTTRYWNVLPDSLIPSAELSDECVSKFISLVRARDLSSSAKPLAFHQ